MEYKDINSEIESNIDIKYELWLTRIDITNTAKNRLTDCLGNAEKVYNSTKTELLSTNMIDEAVADRIIESKDIERINLLYDDFKKLDQSLLTRSMIQFPEKLKKITNAPYGLFYIGDFPNNFDKCISIVGARRCSQYGKCMATEIAYELTKRGYIIVSGMALGIDNAAHEGALKADGITVAVLGCGVDICYPRGNINTYVDIKKKGVIISEQFPKTEPINYNFPSRNRIISALSNQVVIIEAREKSGSLITADFALEQGKDIYALPGRITDTLSGGCNKLIEQGAGIITSVSDFINCIDTVQINTLYTGKDTNCQNLFLEKDDLLVYSCLDFYPKGIEEILAMSNLEMMNVLDSLMNLCEMKLIKEAFVNQYVRIK